MDGAFCKPDLLTADADILFGKALGEFPLLLTAFIAGMSGEYRSRRRRRSGKA